MADYAEKFNMIYQLALKNAPRLEPWEGHYLTRKIETEILIDKINRNENYIGLEVGCGNAFQSTLLASVSKRIFATDLFDKDGHTHSPGMNKAQELISRLDIRNVTLVSCSASALPFSDSHFDFVFSSSALEHIRDRKAALYEMGRVLKPGGRLILIVPTHIASIYAFPHVFIYLLARACKIFLKQGGSEDNVCNSENNQKLSFMARFRKNHPSFPLPEPHGAYKDVFHELRQQSPARWASLISGCGFKITDIVPTCLVPWLLIEPFSTNIAARIYSSTKNINIKLSSFKALRQISYLMGIIAARN